ncbi:hypothetical protein Rsub_06116 [Raphidocelis subcapitata]|uniref:Uncharacterized protein n=1 Tax=Raphidocelis subcapitata TaxID=307507 RepID=A0A2V0P1P1_9CHLO|nr:hypothetical protein Rsub_06116 [Raphidocelis subcapitata]|eukprot:GBF93784.1 hypothetical protein Rsub_06116 [Raphidocelis subcapitata]
MLRHAPAGAVSRVGPVPALAPRPGRLCRPSRRSRPLVVQAARGDGQHQRQQQERQQQQQARGDAEQLHAPRGGPGERLRAALRRALAGAAAATAGLSAAALAALLPARGAAAVDALPPLDAPLMPQQLDTDIIGGVAGGGEVFEIMACVVGIYVALMLLYLLLATALDAPEEPDAGAGADGKADLPPPGYSDWAHARIRSAREPRRGHALVAPPAGEGAADGAAGVAGLKVALAGQAADFVSAQIREVGAVVRRKLYLRRLVARETGRMPSSGAGGGGASGGGGGGVLALALGEPRQLEALVDAALDRMGPAALEAASEDCLVRGITGAVARRLAAAEAGELVRSMQAAVRERGGGGGGGGGGDGALSW